MTSATVTSKGQVTIPVDVRTKLGLRPESWLAYVTTATGGSEIHLQQRRSRISKVPCRGRPSRAHRKLWRPRLRRCRHRRARPSCRLRTHGDLRPTAPLSRMRWDSSSSTEPTSPCGRLSAGPGRTTAAHKPSRRRRTRCTSQSAAGMLRVLVGCVGSQRVGWSRGVTGVEASPFANRSEPSGWHDRAMSQRPAVVWTDELRSRFDELLDEYRSALRARLEDLTEEQARMHLVPSNTTLLGPLKHVTHVEGVWFDQAVTGRTYQQIGIASTPDRSFRLTSSDTIEPVREAHRRRCDASRSAMATLKLDDAVDGSGNTESAPATRSPSGVAEVLPNQLPGSLHVGDDRGFGCVAVARFERLQNRLALTDQLTGDPLPQGR